jgi:DNA-binding LacI/PurR family transcriptional regulator
LDGIGGEQKLQAGAPVRMKDIARDMGLSTVTISKVLRGHSDISEETRKRVLKRMKELNYQPNLAARALITGRTSTIGLVVPDLLHPFFAQIAKAVSAGIRGQGYSLIITSSEEDPDLERQEIEQLLARRVDVMLIASAQWTVETFRRIEERKIPYILIDRWFAGLAANFVGVDDEAVGAIATGHLIDQGCRRIAHIRGPETSTAVGRLEGYRRALAARQLAPLPGTSFPLGVRETIAESRAAMRRRRSCWAPNSARTESSASTTRLPWARCARFSTRACAFPRTLRWWDAATCSIRTFCAFRSHPWIRTAPKSGGWPRNSLLRL